MAVVARAAILERDPEAAGLGVRVQGRVAELACLALEEEGEGEREEWWWGKGGQKEGGERQKRRGTSVPQQRPKTTRAAERTYLQAPLLWKKRQSVDFFSTASAALGPALMLPPPR